MTGTGRKELGEAPWGAEPAGLRLQKQVEKCKHLPEHPHAAQTSCESTGDRRRVLGWHHQHQGGTATCHSPTASPRPVTPNTPRRCCEAWHEQVPGWPRVSVPPRGHNCTACGCTEWPRYFGSRRHGAAAGPVAVPGGAQPHVLPAKPAHTNPGSLVLQPQKSTAPIFLDCPCARGKKKNKMIKTDWRFFPSPRTPFPTFFLKNIIYLCIIKKSRHFNQ